MRSTVRNVHGWAIPQQVGIPRAYDQFEDGELVEDGIRERIEALGRLVAEHADAVSHGQAPFAACDD